MFNMTRFDTKKMNLKLSIYGSLILIIGCKSTQEIRTVNSESKQGMYVAETYEYPDPVDTQDKNIMVQQKRKYTLDDITFDNQFDGARLNDVIKKNDSTYRILIMPENEPINPSPWYAFRIASDKQEKVYIELDYGNYKHRYHPKFSKNRSDWYPLDNDLGAYNLDSTSYQFPLEVNSEPVFVSGQELFTTNDLKEWMGSFKTSPLVKIRKYGSSRDGRDLMMMDVYKGSKNNKKVIVIMSRQHPPEVTGFFAMQAFVESIIATETSFFDNYRMIVYPMLNPDGVDMGHWRHNLGGVDLNRDWAQYNQQEIRLLANHIVMDVKENQSEVILGLDFHSTYEDVYYTQSKSALKTPTTEWLRDEWFDRMEKRIENYKVNESPSGLGRPVSKSWFYTQFKAEGVTYEIGDNTPRDRIVIIGSVAGTELINVLMGQVVNK